MPSIKEIKEYLSTDTELIFKNNFKIRLYNFLGVYISKLFLYTPITGNQVTFLMGILVVISSILFSFGEFWYSIAGFIILHFSITLDSVDGLIARYRNAASIRGIYADLIVHSITSTLTFFGLAIGTFRITNNLFFLICGMSASLFILLCSTVQRIKHQVLVVKLKQYAKGENLDELKDKKFERINIVTDKSNKFIFWKDIIKKILVYLTFGYFTFILIFGIIFNLTHWLLVFYGIALPIKWLIIVFYEFKIDYKHLEYLFKPYKPK